MKRIALVSLTLLLAVGAHATEISGSIPFALVALAQNGTNLSTSTVITSAAALTSDRGTGDFTVVPQFTTFSGPTLTLPVTSGGGFTTTNSSFGTFTATSGTITLQTPQFLDVTLLGTFTPSGVLSSFSPAPAVAHVDYTQTGSSVSGSFTMMTTIPETSTMLLLGTGLVGIATKMRKKF